MPNVIDDTTIRNNVREIYQKNTNELPDSVLDMLTFYPLAKVKAIELVPDYADLGASEWVKFQAGLAYLTASYVADRIKTEAYKSEKGDWYSYTLQDVDWEKVQQDYLDKAYQYFVSANPEIAVSITSAFIMDGYTRAEKIKAGII